MTAPVKERGTRRNHARFGQIYFAVFIPAAFCRAIRSARSDPFMLCNTRRSVDSTYGKLFTQHAPPDQYRPDAPRLCAISMPRPRRPRTAAPHTPEQLSVVLDPGD